MKRIIFLTEQPLNNWNYERFGIDIFLDNNFLVEYWVWGKRENPESQIYNKKIKFFYCKSLTEIKNYVKKTEPFYFIDLIGIHPPKKLFVKRILKKKGCKKILLDTSKLPIDTMSSREILKYFTLTDNLKSSGFTNFLNVIKSLKISYLFRLLFFFPKKFLLNIIVKIFNFKPTFHITAGKQSRLQSENIYGKGLQICSHSLDYEKYLKNSQLQTEENIISFIDQGLPDHFETKIYNRSKWIDKNLYWNKINGFLDQLQKRFNLEVVIACHPRYNTEKVKSNFTKIKNKTYELINRSKIVVTHNSTSANYAIILKKPILFVTSNEMETHPDTLHIYKNIKLNASILNKRIINIDKFNIEDCEKELIVNDELYKSYQNNWIKEENIKTSSTWLEVIKKIQINRFN